MKRIACCVCVIAGVSILVIRPATPTSAVATSQPAGERLMLEIAKTYSQWGRVDDQARWAPFMCAAPSPGTHRFSESDDQSTHGGKIYALYAMDRNAYVGLNDALPKDMGPRLIEAKVSGCDQIIVKESFTPEEIKPGDKFVASGIGPAQRDGKSYRAGEKRDLFIMAHLADPGSAPKDSLDEGWMYATVTPDGKSVTSVGRVASCMKCHDEATHGRLFGLAK